MSDVRGRASRRAPADRMEKLSHVFGVATLAAQFFPFRRTRSAFRTLKHAEGPAAREIM